MVNLLLHNDVLKLSINIQHLKIQFKIIIQETEHVYGKFPKCDIYMIEGIRSPYELKYSKKISANLKS